MIRHILFISFLFSALISIQACTDSQGVYDKTPFDTENTLGGEVERIIIHPSIDHDSTIFYDFDNHPIEIIIKFPTDTVFKGTIMALPGWNYPNSGWCNKTELCNKALSQGYAIILPEMGKSIYCDSIFPETRSDWLKYPTRSWINDIMLPRIQKDFKLLLQEQDNFIMGLSTGARGAVLLAIDHPELFSACAALSGDFDQTRYTKDKLYNGYYGSFDQFTDRWLNNDNAITSIRQLTIPVYLGHGKLDKIVPINYSQQLYDELQKNGNTASELNINPKAGHTYEFWNSEVDAVLTFFRKNSNN